MQPHRHELFARHARESLRQDGAAVLAALLRGVAPASAFVALIVLFLSPALCLGTQDDVIWRFIISLYQLSLLLTSMVRLVASLAVLAPRPKNGLPVESRWSIFPNNEDHAAFAALVATALGWIP